MDLSPLIIAIPLYFALMAIELMYESITHKRTYRLNDAITNINTGVLQQLSGIFFKVIKIGIYIIIYEKLAFVHIPETGLSFFVLFILWDFCYYWEHRFAHEISLFWGGHSVHHQSEDYNLSVALRQSSTAFIWGTPFYLPLALLGFSPTHFVLVGGFNLIYQFWIHTEHIKRLPSWFEYLMNTPSHHRVHHGRDPKYLDKNYGGVFIIFDRIFGTFKKEEERPHYGVTKPLKSWNPVYANFAHYIELYKYVRQSRSFSDSLKILFKPPGWLPDYLGGVQIPTEVTPNYHKYNASTPSGKLNWYILVQFIAALGLIAYFFFSTDQFDRITQILFALWITLSTLTFGFLFEYSWRWLSVLEVLRLLVIPVGAYALISGGVSLPYWLPGLAIVFAIGSIVAFFFQQAIHLTR